MTSIEILMDKIAKLEHADAIQNSRIKQLEMECNSLDSILKCWTKSMSEWNAPGEDEAWLHLQGDKIIQAGTICRELTETDQSVELEE